VGGFTTLTSRAALALADSIRTGRWTQLNRLGGEFYPSWNPCGAADGDSGGRLLHYLTGRGEFHFGRLNADETRTVASSGAAYVVIPWRCRRTENSGRRVHRWPRERNYIRLNADGTLDTSFNPGREEQPSVRAVHRSAARCKILWEQLRHARRAEPH